MFPDVGTRTAIQRLADHLLGGTLDDYVVSRRQTGASWRQISLSLRDDIGVDVTHETLRGWYREAEDTAVGAA